MNKLTDNDIREALKRREARRTKPEVPADFCADIMQEIAPEPVGSVRYAYIVALAAAACIAFAVLMVWPKGGEQKSDGCTLVVRKEQTSSPSPKTEQDTVSRLQPVEVTVHKPKRTDRQLVARHSTPAASSADSLDYYIAKIERELAQVDDSLYIERIHRVMHADERLQRIVNNYILNELHKDAKSSEANNINNVKTDEDEE